MKKEKKKQLLKWLLKRSLKFFIGQKTFGLSRPLYLRSQSIELEKHIIDRITIFLPFSIFSAQWFNKICLDWEEGSDNQRINKKVYV